MSNLPASELKMLLKTRASKELGDNLHNPEYRLTFWSQNGLRDFSYEGHAEYDHEMAHRVGDRLFKNKSDTAILDVLEYRLLLYRVEVG